MKRISSRENARYKELKAVAEDAAARRKLGMTVLDGIHLCAAYLESHGVPEMCAVSESGLAHREVSALAERCAGSGAFTVVLPDSLLKAVSPVEHGVGLVCMVRIPVASLAEVINGDALLLDAVQDPGNLGSILRSAAAAGIRKVYCGRGTASVWSPKVLRAGMGAHFLLEIAEQVDLDALGAEEAVRMAATSSHAAQALFDVDLRGPVAWMFGNEGRGVSAALSSRAQLQLSIPQPGAIESLNVAASAAVCLFEQVRQRRR